MSIKIGDKVRQTSLSTYLNSPSGNPDIEPQEDEAGTVVDIYPGVFAYHVNFPRIDEGVWPFKEDEIEKVEDEA